MGEKIREILADFSMQIGVDLGSNNILIYLKDRGIVIDEPSMVARAKRKRWTGLSAPKTKTSTLIAYGFRAKEMFSREPRSIEVVSPVKNGVVSDLEAVEAMLLYYLRLVYEIPSRHPKLLKPRVIAGVANNINDVQRRAIKSVFLTAGAREVILVEQAVLVALSMGIPVEKWLGMVIVDFGGGKTEVSVVSMGGIILNRSIKIGGDDLDWDIVNYVKMKYGLLIGKNTAERVKTGEMSQLLARGRDLGSGLPKSVKLERNEIREAISLNVAKMIKLVSTVLDETPPELMDDILKRGIILTGGGSKLEGLVKKVEEATQISATIVEDPDLCVVKGCGELIEKPLMLKQIKSVLLL